MVEVYWAKLKCWIGFHDFSYMVLVGRAWIRPSEVSMVAGDEVKTFVTLRSGHHVEVPFSLRQVEHRLGLGKGESHELDG